MKHIDKILSRRAMLGLGVRSLAGVGLLGYVEPLTAGVGSAERILGSRALVCIYLLGGEGDVHLAERSIAALGGLAPNREATELRALQRTGALTVLTNDAPRRTGPAATQPGEVMAQRHAGLRFLPNGFATPEWAAQLAGIRGVRGEGAFTFKGGMSLVSPGARSRQGDQFENAEIRQAMSEVAPLRTVFPNTALGRQLQDVTRLLKVSGDLGLDRPVFLCVAGGFTRDASRTGLLVSRYRELSQALASFHAGTVELGMEQRVTTYTDAELSPIKNSGTSARLALGGAATRMRVAGGDLSADACHRQLAGWQGVPAAQVRRVFPALTAGDARG